MKTVSLSWIHWAATIKQIQHESSGNDSGKVFGCIYVSGFLGSRQVSRSAL